MEQELRDDRWLEEMPEEEWIQAPHYMKNKIIRSSKILSGQILPLTRQQKRRKLLLYGLKVMAASAALIALICLPAMTGMETRRISWPELNQNQTVEQEYKKEHRSALQTLSDSSNGLCDKLLEFTHDLTQWEVFKYEHE